MSAVASILKQRLLRSAHGRELPVGVAAEAVLRHEHDEDTVAVALVRQVFLNHEQPRRRILFATAECETGSSALCERIGRVLAQLSGEAVALVESAQAENARSACRKEPQAESETAPWRAGACQMGERLWRIPFSALLQEELQDGSPRTFPFGYFVLSTDVRAGIAPLLCRACDGVVLLLRANQTRRESALRAKELLQLWNSDLLGVVLDNRVFPIPESVYRRL